MNELTKQQQEGKLFIIDKGCSVIVADVAGAGKTYMILDSLLEQQINNLPALIITIKPGLSVWESELIKWYNLPSVVYTGTPKKRELLQNEIATSQFVITTYPMLKELLDKFGSSFFKTLVLDEYHMYGFINRKSKFYKQVHSICRKLKVIPTSGTPMRRNPSDLFTALSVVDPNRFTSFWKFANEFCIVTKDRFGYVIEQLPNNVAEFRAMLSNYMLRREKDDLPPRIRQAIISEMTQKQNNAYKQLVAAMTLELSDDKVLLTPNQMTKILRCRQLLVTPRIFGIDENGGALDMLLDQVELELSNDNPCIIFTPFTEAIPFIEQQLRLKLKSQVLIYKIHGGMTYEQYKDVQEQFQTEPSTNKLVICSIKSGASMTLTDATVALFLGYEWSPTDQDQAESRTHRKGQTKSVRCLYFLYKGTSDELIIDTLNQKQLSIDVSIGLTPHDYYAKMISINNLGKEIK